MDDKARIPNAVRTLIASARLRLNLIAPLNLHAAIGDDGGGNPFSEVYSMCNSVLVPVFALCMATMPSDLQRPPRAFLGVTPEYGFQVKGVKLESVVKDGPAAKAGVRGGDVVVKLGESDILNLRDFVSAIRLLKVGKKVTLTVKRKGMPFSFEVVPKLRTQRRRH